MTVPLKTRILLADDHTIVRGGLKLVLDAQPDLEVVAEASDGAEAVELVIYRVVQESLTNALRHANPTTVTVAVETSDERVTVSVMDDGTGMPGEAPRGTAGIAGMRERALLVGGRLTIESGPGEGTEVRLEVSPDGDGS